MGEGVIFLIITVIAAALFSWAATGMALRLLQRYRILDNPNQRSLHTVPTPRGGGWGPMLTVLLVLAVAAYVTGAVATCAWVSGAIVLLMGVSWLDDVRPQPALLRFGIQMAAVVMGFQALPDTPVLQGWVPLWVEWLLVGIGWLWFINLYNFMDGIDGITGAETLAIALGAVVLAALALPGDAFTLLLAAGIGGAAAGFLMWNWHPAKVFMGDVGSVPLGFILGFVLLTIAAHGYVLAALILPLYYIADATFTLLRRAVQGKKVYEAHREHIYQTAAAVRGHAPVVRLISMGNTALVVCAVLTVHYGWVLAVPAILITLLVCLRLVHWSRP
jgi:UDP-N-acetylmuramyl pentapeptide phosphotransferase/UDP-N-acetylglucosamine-1-phosphate transferase